MQFYESTDAETEAITHVLNDLKSLAINQGRYLTASAIADAMATLEREPHQSHVLDEIQAH